MRVAINATVLLSPLTGIGQYVYSLVSVLKNLDNLEVDLFYGTSWSDELRTNHLQGIVTFKSLIKRFIPNSYGLNRFVQQKFFSKGVFSRKPDIYHEPNFLPYNFPGNCITTVHDLSWIRYPESHPVNRVKSMNRHFEVGLNKSIAIVTDSFFVKNEIVNTFGISPSKIYTIHLGVNKQFYPRVKEEIRSSLKFFNLDSRKYLLVVGTLEPRKNINLVLDAWEQLPQKIRNHYSLVFIGMDGWRSSSIKAKLSRLQNKGEIVNLGYVSADIYPLILSGALALVYPSFYEGFGLPPVEAMASGVPVIVSKTSSHPEVVGDAGIFIDPHDSEQLMRSMQELIMDEKLQHIMIKKGIKRSLNFTWENCALKTVKVYEKFCSSV